MTDKEFLELAIPKVGLGIASPLTGSRLRKPLSIGQCALLEQELKREDLQIFTVVRMAQKDLAKGDYNIALCRLLQDADKLRDEKELYAIIRYYFD